MTHLHHLRKYELEFALQFLPPPPGNLLEIGGGSGYQASLLKQSGYSVTSIDLESSKHLTQSFHPVLPYDGMHIPCKDNSIDIVFSSNCLEHVIDIDFLVEELLRITRSGAYFMHILPSHHWRRLTTITYLLRYLRIPSPHGVASTSLDEEYSNFHPDMWKGFFNNYFNVRDVVQIPLCYSGTSLMGNLININTRALASRLFGASTLIYTMVKR